MLILFQLVSFSLRWSHHSPHPQDHFQVFSTVFLPSVPSCLCFPPSHHFLQGLRFLNRVSILLMGRLSILFRQCSYPVISHEDAQQFQVHHPSLLFLLRWIQFKLSIFIIFLSLFLMLSHADAPLNHSLLPIHLFWSAEDISQDSCFHSQSVQVILRLLSHSSHLILPVQSLF